MTNITSFTSFINTLKEISNDYDWRYHTIPRWGIRAGIRAKKGGKSYCPITAVHHALTEETVNQIESETVASDYHDGPLNMEDPYQSVMVPADLSEDDMGHLDSPGPVLERRHRIEQAVGLIEAK